jgi:DNA sulfur modification protein DndC
MKFRKEFLEKLLRGQMKIKTEYENAPDIELILEDEIHEIQRIWRLEQSDWTDSAYEIYRRVTGKNLKTKNEFGSLEKTEQDFLKKACSSHNTPFKLVGNLLSLEILAQGANRHSKIHNKISSELKKEWRDVDDPNLFKKILRSKKDFKEKMTSYPSKSNVKTGDKS